MIIKDFLSRYNLRYPRFLVYMLQASEYDPRDYFVWYKRTKNFNFVEKRGRFTKTRKAILLLTIAWLIILPVYIGNFFLFTRTDYFSGEFGSFLRHPIFFFIMLAAPYFLAYGIVIPLIIVKFFIQRPIEYFIIRRAKRKLKRHKALKIAVAGSFGKTSMREILKAVLSEGKKVAAASRNHNTPLGISRFIDSLFGDEEVLIFEFGEYYPGDIRKLCDLVQPEIGVITGINEAHLKKFKKIERTVKTVYELADYLGGKPAYVNGENNLARENARFGHILYNREGVGDWTIENLKTNLNGTSFVLIKTDKRIEFSSGLFGLHQAGPLAAAADIALSIGLSFDQVNAGVSKTKSFDHRLELKIDSAGVIILDDSYNGNPDGVRAAIGFLAFLKDHRRFFVTPGLVEMGTQTEEVHRQIGKDLAKAEIEKIVLIKNSVTSYIEEGLKESGYESEILRFPDAFSAFAALPHLTVKGDIVLLQNDWPDQYQ